MDGLLDQDGRGGEGLEEPEDPRHETGHQPEQDHWLPFKILGANLFRRRQTVRIRKDHHQVFGAQQFEVQARHVARVPDQSQVQVSVQQLLNLLAAGEGLQHKVNARALLAESPEGLRHGGIARGADEPHPDLAALACGDVGNVSGGIIKVRHGGLDPVPERLASRRQRHTARGAVEELDTKLTLESLDGHG